ncbi:hypothetical protein IEQ34_013668 [Dendrobium chrysotoxum]|uniref:Uncharacterized protein n=1 Tax=Dendrobium chrysotoxum TaxID=161865 RepID=A0AAV7GRM9_DENCH|nr:hypothetical protein IEQ34_013668 [Dendrobium chrysotoxum]
MVPENDSIDSKVEGEVDLKHAVRFLRDLCVQPSITVSFTFKSLESIGIGESYSIGCVATADINVDILSHIPKECFHEKGYLNHIYHAKRIAKSRCIAFVRYKYANEAQKARDNFASQYFLISRNMRLHKSSVVKKIDLEVQHFLVDALDYAISTI